MKPNSTQIKKIILTGIKTVSSGGWTCYKSGLSLIIMGIACIFSMEHIGNILREGMISIIDSPHLLVEYVLLLIWFFIIFCCLKKIVCVHSISALKLTWIAFFYFLLPYIVLQIMLYSFISFGPHFYTNMAEIECIHILWFILICVVTLIFGILGCVVLSWYLGSNTVPLRFKEALFRTTQIGWLFLIISYITGYLGFYIMYLIYNINIENFPLGLLLTFIFLPVFLLYWVGYFIGANYYVIKDVRK